MKIDIHDNPMIDPTMDIPLSTSIHKIVASCSRECLHDLTEHRIDADHVMRESISNEFKIKVQSDTMCGLKLLSSRRPTKNIKISGASTRYEHVEIFFNELVKIAIDKGYPINLIVGGEISSFILSSYTLHIPSPTETASTSGPLIYKIGSYMHYFNIFVDPMIRYDDRDIYTFDNPFMNFKIINTTSIVDDITMITKTTIEYQSVISPSEVIVQKITVPEIEY